MDRCDRSMMVIKRTIENNYDKFKTVGVFYLEKNAVLAEIAAKSEEEIAAIADECREMGVRWRMFAKVMGAFEKKLLDGVETLDLSQSEEKIPGGLAGAVDQLIAVTAVQTTDDYHILYGQTVIA